MRILVTGAGGMLGSALVPALAEAGHEVYATDLVPSGDGAFAIEKLDVRSRDAIASGFGRARPHFVVHLAAETDLEVCESDPDHAYHTNALGTKHVALACRIADVPLAYVSTAGVFDGASREPYTEFDAPNPINHYGNSKYAGERFVQTFLSRFYIVRAGWMVGGGRKDHKFVAKILAQLKSGATRLYAVRDKWGTPTYAPDFARCFTRLIATESYGLYHMASLGRANRYDVARKILAVLGREDVDLRAVDSDHFRESYPAPRPASEMMRNLVLELQGLNTMRPWEDAIEEYLEVALPELAAARV